MNYQDAMEQDDISQVEALAELKKHGASVVEFFEDVGNKPVYTGEEVLGWLGY